MAARAAVGALCACLLSAGMSANRAADAYSVGVVGSSRIGIRAVTSGWEICVGGSVGTASRITGQWTLAISGVRGTESFVEPMWVSAGYSVYYCTTVSKRGQVTGYLSADFGYSGAGSYVFAHSTGGAAWDPSLGNQAFEVDPTP